MDTIEESILASAMDYPAYRALLEQLNAEGKTTGPDQSEAMIKYSDLNFHRMLRWEKTAVFTEEHKKAIAAYSSPLTILIITEAWCGDAAQQVVWFAKLEEINPNIQVRFVLRDENLSLMDRYLTNGGRAIPVALFLNEKRECLLRWGPRPQALQKLMQEWSAEGIAKEEKITRVHTWYAKDKGLTLQAEIADVFIRS